MIESYRRGINPPHRVKSISMASFTQEEVDMLTQRGNEVSSLHMYTEVHIMTYPYSLTDYHCRLE